MSAKKSNNLEFDVSDDINTIRGEIYEFVKERDWLFYHTPKALSIAISIEAAELLEHFLFKDDDYVPENEEAFLDEMADIFIYLMSLANRLGVDDFLSVVRRKIEKNKKKYPKEIFSGKNYRKQ